MLLETVLSMRNTICVINDKCIVTNVIVYLYADEHCKTHNTTQAAEMGWKISQTSQIIHPTGEKNKIEDLDIITLPKIPSAKRLFKLKSGETLDQVQIGGGRGYQKIKKKVPSSRGYPILKNNYSF